jgi:hypothetical protein
MGGGGNKSRRGVRGRKSEGIKRKKQRGFRNGRGGKGRIDIDI